MSIIENEGVINYVDESGNQFLMYPVTKVGLVDGLDERLNEKQDTIIGTNGQVVGFDATGAAVAQDANYAPVSHISDGVKHITASERTAWNAKLDNYTETDPTVPAWAKAASKPSYTANEVGADASGSAAQALTDAKSYTDTQIAAIPTPDVSGQINTHNTSTSAHNDIRELVNGLTTRLNALADSDDTTLDQLSEIVAYIKNNKSLIDGITTSKVNVDDIIDNITTNVSNKPLSAAQGVALKALIDAIVVPTKVSELTNDSGYLTSYTETDPTVPAWAKADSKPTYTADEVGAAPASHTSDTTIHITDDERTVWNAKADGTHASTHATDGSDPITPAMVRLDKSALLKNVEVALPSSPNGWSSVTFGNNRFVSISFYSDIAAYSDDGITWTQTALPSSQPWQSVTFGNNRFVAVTYGGNKVAYSDDGITWTQTTIPSSTDWYSVTFGNNRFVAVARYSNTAAYSDDGITWNLVTLPAEESKWQSVTFGNNRFVAIAGNSDISAYSDDGITWTQTVLPEHMDWISVTFGNNRFVAIAGDSDFSAYSDDGITWTQTTLPVFRNWRSVTFGNNRFVAIKNDSNVAAYSNDGITWTRTTLPSSAYWISVTFGNNRFVAIAGNSAAYSDDGITWYNSIDVLTYPDNTDIKDRMKSALGIVTMNEVNTAIQAAIGNAIGGSY